MATDRRRELYRAAVARDRHRQRRVPTALRMVAPHHTAARHAVRLTTAGKIRERTGHVQVSPDLRWQAEAFALSQSIGELGQVHRLTANTVARGRLVVREETGPDEYDDIQSEGVAAAADRVMRALRGERGGRKLLIANAAHHLQVPGESFLLGTPWRDEEAGRDLGVVWEFVSPLELDIRVGGVRRRRDGVTWENVPDDHYLARMWRPSPEFSDRASSAMHDAMPIAREIDGLSQKIGAAIDSGMAAKMLLLPESISWAAPPGETVDGDGVEQIDLDVEGEDEIDLFIAELIDHLSKPVEDPTNPARLVPFLLQADREDLKEIRVVDLGRPLATEDLDARERALVRLANALDIEPEIMTGKTSLNHWTAYVVDADFLARHVVPLGEDVADFLTHSYLRPWLAAAEHLDDEVLDRLVVRYDASPLEARADGAASARAMYDRDSLTVEAMLRANGFDAADIPKPNDRRVRMLRRIIEQHPVAFREWMPLLPEFDGVDLPAIDTQALFDPASGGGGGGDAPVSPDQADGPDATSGMEEPDPQPPSGQALLAAQVHGLAEMAVVRARERAASIVLNHARRDRQVLARIEHAPKAEILDGRVTLRDLTAIGLTVDRLAPEGTWDHMHQAVRRAVTAALQRPDPGAAPDPDAVQAGVYVADRLVDTLHRWFVDDAAALTASADPPLDVVDDAVAYCARELAPA